MDGLKIFVKKSELLEYLGKDKKNVRYLDKMIADGELIKRDGMYFLSKDIIAEALILLSIQPKTVEDRSGEIERLREELKATNENLEYMNEKYVELTEDNKQKTNLIDDLIEKGIIQRGF